MHESIEKITVPSEVAAAQCAQEPIRFPGAVQSHGVLFVLDEQLGILQVSENCASLIGRKAESLLGTSILELVDPAAAKSVEALIRDAAFTYVNPFRVPVRVGGEICHFDGIAHIVEGAGMVLELEMDSTVSTSGTEGLDNYLQVVQRSLALIADMTQVPAIAEVMAREVKAFTGFDRVMVYQFAPDEHGHVVAEAREPEMEPYLGLHYPASDIPAQARELYRTNVVRLLRDVDAEPALLVPQVNPKDGRQLNMSRSVLRSMSPVHVRYLKNMGVGASMSISLIVQNKLWGLIACHHRTPHFVPYAIRATVSLYGIVMAAQLEVKQHSKSNEQVASARRNALSILTTSPDFTEPLGDLPAMLPKLMNLFSASGAVLVTEGETFREGSTPDDSIWPLLKNELDRESIQGVVICNRAAERFPSLASFASTAAGLVGIHLGGNEWLVMVRGQIVRQIMWAGNPDEAKIIGESGALTPRNSFKAWMQEVAGECEPWPEETSLLTTEVRSALLEIIQRRNTLLARSNQDLRRFAGVVAHEVKNHLQTAIMALSLIEENRDAPLPAPLVELTVLGRDRLTGLAEFIDELLVFSGTQISTKSDVVDLNQVLVEIVREMEVAGLAAGAEIHIQGLPSVVAPETQLRHVLTNLIRNALVHARCGNRMLEIEVGFWNDDGVDVVYVRDNGKGIPADQLNKIFDYFYRGDPTSPGSGIGLAFCAQALDRMGMRIWVANSSPQGTTFCFSVSVA